MYPKSKIIPPMRPNINPNIAHMRRLSWASLNLPWSSGSKTVLFSIKMRTKLIAAAIRAYTPTKRCKDMTEARP